MAERVFLHVGTPKSGTTFLQTLLWHHRERLAARGLLVPGSKPFDHNLVSMALRGAPENDGGGDTPTAGAQLPAKAQQTRDAVVAAVAAWPGDAVLSNEWLVLAGARQVADTVAAFAPAEVDVVVTARDLTRVVPAAWQESLKVGLAGSLADFVTTLDAGEGRWSWAALDPAQVLATWAGGVPAHRVHVVTVPAAPSDSRLLWHRFTAVLGLHPAGLNAAAGRTNESLSAESAALLQRIGPALRAAVAPPGSHWRQPYRWVRNYVAHELLVPRGGSRIALREAELEPLRARSAVVVRRLGDAGYDVAGDLADLIPSPAAAEGRHPDDIDASELLDLAGHVMADLLARVRREDGGAAREQRPAEATP